jgi:hypothetical protein
MCRPVCGALPVVVTTAASAAAKATGTEAIISAFAHRGRLPPLAAGSALSSWVEVAAISGALPGRASMSVLCPDGRAAVARSAVLSRERSSPAVGRSAGSSASAAWTRLRTGSSKASNSIVG